MSLTVDLAMPSAAPIWRVLKAPPCSSCSVCRILLIVTLGVGIADSGQKTGQRMPRSGHTEHLAGVRHQFGMLSAFTVERCPASRWNTVRHQRGIVSAMAWNTQPAIGFLAVKQRHVVLEVAAGR